MPLLAASLLIPTPLFAVRLPLVVSAIVTLCLMLPTSALLGALRAALGAILTISVARAFRALLCLVPTMFAVAVAGVTCWPVAARVAGRDRRRGRARRQGPTRSRTAARQGRRRAGAAVGWAHRRATWGATLTDPVEKCTLHIESGYFLSPGSSR